MHENYCQYWWLLPGDSKDLPTLIRRKKIGTSFVPDDPSLMNDSPLPALRGPSAVEDGSYFLEVTEAKIWGFCYLSLAVCIVPITGLRWNIARASLSISLTRNCRSKLLNLPPWQRLGLNYSIFLLLRTNSVQKNQSAKMEVSGCASVIKSSPPDRQCQGDETLPRKKGKRERASLQQLSLFCKAALIKIGPQEPSATAP